MLQNRVHFDLTSAIASSPASCAFEHGESYPAIIAGLWTGQTTWQDTTSDGFAMLLIVKDDNGKLTPRAGKFIKCYQGYNIFNEKTAFTKLMQGMLGTTSTGADLQKEVIEAGMGDISSLIGKSCSVRIALKKSERGVYATVDDVSRPSSKRPGLDPSELTTVDVDVRKVFGKFITIPDVTSCAHISAVHVIDPAEAAKSGANVEAIKEYGDF